MSSSDEFQVGFHDNLNWWDHTSRSDRFIRTGAAPAASITSQPTAETVKSMSTGGGSHHLQVQVQAWHGATALCGGGATNPNNLPMMGSAAAAAGAMSWDQPRLMFRSMIQEDLNSEASCNFHQESDPSESCSEQNWSHRLYSGFHPSNSEKPPSNNSNGDCSHHLAAFNDQMDSAAAAAYGLLVSEIQPHNSPAYENMVMDYPYPPSSPHNAAAGSRDSWNKFQHFLRASPPPPLPPATTCAGIHFNTPSWSPSAPMNESPSSFLSGAQIHRASPSSFDEKPKKTVGAAARESGTTKKKNSTEPSNKRSRGSETSSPLPSFKVRKENLREKIAALQQLVSPFGKTDTASVLYEAFQCIQSLQEQVRVLVSPYMTKAGGIRQNQMQISPKVDPERNLRSRGLCLVPTSSTFAVTNETNVDFWTPRYGGFTFR